MVQHKHLPRFSPNHWSMILMVLLASVIKNILILTPSKRNMSVGSPLHYRLRCTIGFLNVKKSKWLFLTQGTPKYDNFALFVKIMTQILYQKSFIVFSENKYGQNHSQCSEKVEGGLSRG